MASFKKLKTSENKFINIKPDKYEINFSDYSSDDDQQEDHDSKNYKLHLENNKEDDQESDEEEEDAEESEEESANESEDEDANESEEEDAEESEEESTNESEEGEDEEPEDVEQSKPDKNNKYDKMKDAIKQELNQMSFEEVMKLQNKLGLKKFKEVMTNNQDNENTKQKGTSFTRANKNRPQELTSKKPVPILRNVFQVKKRESIDPRFNSAFGEYRPDLFRKSYGFINDLRKNEKELLTQQLKEETDPKIRAQTKEALSRLKQQLKSHEESEKQELLKQNYRKQALIDAKDGKKPHFVNKTEKKILELAEKYKELKKTGQIENYLAKKRKKQLSKDSKHLSRNEHLRFV